MEIQEGGGRTDYQDVLRAVGAFADRVGLREMALVETSEGFVLQGLAPHLEEGRWSEAAARITRQTFHLDAQDLERIVDEASARRDQGRPPAAQVPNDFYEQALRVLGHYLDEQKPRGVLLFEQDRSFVVRLLASSRSGPGHVLAEFTSEEVEALIGGASQLRGQPGSSSILDAMRDVSG